MTELFLKHIKVSGMSLGRFLYYDRVLCLRKISLLKSITLALLLITSSSEEIPREYFLSGIFDAFQKVA